MDDIGIIHTAKCADQVTVSRNFVCRRLESLVVVIDVTICCHGGSWPSLKGKWLSDCDLKTRLVRTQESQYRAT